MTNPLRPAPSGGSAARALTPAELGRLLVGWNDTARDVPGVTWPELFEAQAARTPGAPAVICGGLTRGHRRPALYRDRGTPALIESAGSGRLSASPAWLKASWISLEGLRQPGGHDGPLPLAAARRVSARAWESAARHLVRARPSSVAPPLVSRKRITVPGPGKDRAQPRTRCVKHRPM
jgi:hypothetical protein